MWRCYSKALLIGCSAWKDKEQLKLQGKLSPRNNCTTFKTICSKSSQQKPCHYSNCYMESTHNSTPNRYSEKNQLHCNGFYRHVWFLKVGHSDCCCIYVALFVPPFLKVEHPFLNQKVIRKLSENLNLYQRLWNTQKLWNEWVKTKGCWLTSSWNYIQAFSYHD